MKPFEWVRLVEEDAGLPSRAVLVAHVLACRSTPGPPAHSRLSLRDIQRLTHIAKKHVVTLALRDLEAAGWIAEQPLSIASPKGGQRHFTTVHHFVIPAQRLGLLAVDNPAPDGEGVGTSGTQGWVPQVQKVGTSGTHKKIEDQVVDPAVARVAAVDNPTGQHRVLDFIAGIADAKRLR